MNEQYLFEDKYHLTVGEKLLLLLNDLVFFFSGYFIGRFL
jgi:hypothetical protein